MANKLEGIRPIDLGPATVRQVETILLIEKIKKLVSPLKFPEDLEKLETNLCGTD